MKKPSTLKPLLALALLTAFSTACLPDGGELEPIETATVDVALIANDAANVDRFDLSVRQLSVATWNTQSLAATLSGSRATAQSILSLTPGEHVLRAEAYDVGGTLMGFPREVRISLFPGVHLPVTIELDLAELGEGAAGTVTATITGQNGADINQTSLTSPHVDDVVSTTLTIDSVSDYEGDPIRTGFVIWGVQNTPEFFSETSTSTTFTTYALPSIYTAIAVAVDDSSVGTAHVYTFDTSQNPSFQDMAVWRVNDVRNMAGGANDLIVMSRDGGGIKAWGDFDGDLLMDHGIENSTEVLLSWGVSPTDPGEYVLRARDPGGVIRIYTFNYVGTAAPVSQALE